MTFLENVSEKLARFRRQIIGRDLYDRAARPELEALLDDMAWQQRRAGGGSGLMDPTQVRALLGIPERSR